MYANGNKANALDYFRKAVDITPTLAYTFMKWLKKEKIEYMVAPYEADAQLAYVIILIY